MQSFQERLKEKNKTTSAEKPLTYLMNLKTMNSKSLLAALRNLNLNYEA
jgi:hypothetical protein